MRRNGEEGGERNCAQTLIDGELGARLSAPMVVSRVRIQPEAAQITNNKPWQIVVQLTLQHPPADLP
jgi:hypothetical protein